MKRCFNLFLFAVFWSLSNISFGQGAKKYDPSYSVHNYKHPNKAQEAIKGDSSRLQPINYLNALFPGNSNYKAQNIRIFPKPEVVNYVREDREIQKPERNYKQQFPPTSK